MRDDREHTYCPNVQTPYLFSDDSENRKRKIIKARCKLWNCPYCKYVNKHQHYIRILHGSNQLLSEGKQLNFTTLTSHEKLKTFEACRTVWKSAWNKLRARARRKCRTTVQDAFIFVWIPETHKDGRLHFHFINTGEISTRWWKDNARECGLGYQAKSEQLDNAVQAVNYTLKYISKTLDSASYPKKMRRVNYAQKFPAKPAFEATIDWQVAEAKTSIIDLIHEGWIRLDYDVYLHGEHIKEIIEE